MDVQNRGGEGSPSSRTRSGRPADGPHLVQNFEINVI